MTWGMHLKNFVPVLASFGVSRLLGWGLRDEGFHWPERVRFRIEVKDSDAA